MLYICRGCIDTAICSRRCIEDVQDGSICIYSFTKHTSLSCGVLCMLCMEYVSHHACIHAVQLHSERETYTYTYTYTYTHARTLSLSHTYAWVWRRSICVTSRLIRHTRTHIRTHKLFLSHTYAYTPTSWATWSRGTTHVLLVCCSTCVTSMLLRHTYTHTLACSLDS
jgi:hypothetical protein